VQVSEHPITRNFNLIQCLDIPIVDAAIPKQVNVTDIVSVEPMIPPRLLFRVADCALFLFSV
jgi:hypothetical protein